MPISVSGYDPQGDAVPVAPQASTVDTQPKVQEATPLSQPSTFVPVPEEKIGDDVLRAFMDQKLKGSRFLYGYWFMDNRIFVVFRTLRTTEVRMLKRLFQDVLLKNPENPGMAWEGWMRANLVVQLDSLATDQHDEFENPSPTADNLVDLRAFTAYIDRSTMALDEHPLLGDGNIASIVVKLHTRFGRLVERLTEAISSDPTGAATL